MNKDDLVDKLKDISFINNKNNHPQESTFRKILKLFLKYKEYKLVAGKLPYAQQHVNNVILEMSAEIVGRIGTGEINQFLLQEYDLQFKVLSDISFDKRNSKAVFALKDPLEEALSESSKSSNELEQEKIKKHFAEFKYNNEVHNQIRGLAHLFVGTTKLQERLLDQSYFFKQEALSKLVESLCHIQELNRIKKHKDVVYDICFDSKNNIVASSSSDSTVQVFKLNSLQSFWNENECINYNECINSDDVRVWCVQISNNKLATVTTDGKIRIYPLDSERQNQKPIVIDGSKQSIKSVSFSRDDKYLASVGNDQAIKIWECDGEIWDSNEEKVCVKKTEKSHAHDNYIQVVRFLTLSDRYIIITGGFDNQVKVWYFDEEILTHETTIKHGDRIFDIAFENEKNRIASASKDKTIKIHQLNIKEENEEKDSLQCSLLKQISCPNLVRCICFTPDNQKIVAGLDDKTIKIYSLNSQDNDLIEEFKGNGDRIWSVDTDKNNRILCGDDNSDIRVLLYNNLNLEENNIPQAKTFLGHNNTVNTVDISHDAKRIVSGGDDQLVKVWDAIEKEALNTNKGHEDLINEVKFLPGENNIIASASSDATIKFWKDNKEIDQATDPQNAKIMSISFNHPRRVIAAANAHGLISFWDYRYISNEKQTKKVMKLEEMKLEEWNIKKKIENFISENNIDFNQNQFMFNTKIIFGNNGSNFFAIAAGSTLILFNYKAQQVEDIITYNRKIYNIAFNSCNTQLAFTSFDGIIGIYSLQEKNLKKEIKAGNKNDRIYSVSFSEDDQFIISSHFDSSIKVWDLSGKLKRTYQGHKSRVLSLKMSNTGKTFVSASADKTVKWWYFDKNLFTEDVDKQLSKLLDYIKQNYRQAFKSLERTGFDNEEFNLLKDEND
jgi:WD40 repeat protein